MTITRIRWVETSPLTPEKIAERIKISSKTENNGDCGFLKQPPEGEAYRFKFFWKTSVSVATLDADGLELFRQVESTNFLDLTLKPTKAGTLLRVTNSGRSLARLLQQLERIVGQEFSSQIVTINPEQHKELARRFDDVRVISLKLLGSIGENDVMARVELTSKGRRLDRNLKFVREMNSRTELASYEILHQGLRGVLTISASGAVKVSGSLSPLLGAEAESLIGKAGENPPID